MIFPLLYFRYLDLIVEFRIIFSHFCQKVRTKSSKMFRKVFCLVNFIFFFNFSASDFNSWDSDTYVPDICVCVPEGKCSYAGG